MAGDDGLTKLDRASQPVDPLQWHLKMFLVGDFSTALEVLRQRCGNDVSDHGIDARNCGTKWWTYVLMCSGTLKIQGWRNDSRGGGD